MGRKKLGRNVGSEPGEKEPVGLRIIGGKYRGSKLQYTGDNRVRPMKDRVRESVFNLIGPAVKGTHVIDLFAGTGAIAIEALSRGSRLATLIEIHLPTASLLKKNLEGLDLLPVCNLFKTDAFYWVKSELSLPGADIPWLVFCCPPYEFYVSRREEMLAMLQRLYDFAPPGSQFVIESDEHFDFASLPMEPPAHRIRHYPPAKIGIF